MYTSKDMSIKSITILGKTNHERYWSMIQFLKDHPNMCLRSHDETIHDRHTLFLTKDDQLIKYHSISKMMSEIKGPRPEEGPYQSEYLFVNEQYIAYDICEAGIIIRDGSLGFLMSVKVDYDALLDEVTFGDTTVSLEIFQEHVESLHSKLKLLEKGLF